MKFLTWDKKIIGTVVFQYQFFIVVATAAGTVADPRCHLMPTMIISGGGMNSQTPASYFRHDSFTLQITIIQVGLSRAFSIIYQLIKSAFIQLCSSEILSKLKRLFLYKHLKQSVLVHEHSRRRLYKRIHIRMHGLIQPGPDPAGSET